MAEEKAWSQVNRRRAELIRKCRESGLTAEESKELDQLQRTVDQRLEPMDRQLLAAARAVPTIRGGTPRCSETVNRRPLRP